jgi:signal transduction histidine kinase
MTALLESLLALARADANVETISLAPVSLNLLVMEVADHWRPLAQRQGLTLNIVGSSTPAWVMGDITALRRCTAILMENACRYTESGTVEIGLEAEQGFVTLWVRDTGIGIAPQHMPHLFERCYKGNSPIDILSTASRGSYSVTSPVPFVRFPLQGMALVTFS